MKVERNSPCPCGSNKKYKKCCLAKDEQIEAKMRDNHAREWKIWFENDLAEGRANLKAMGEKVEDDPKPSPLVAAALAGAMYSTMYPIRQSEMSPW